MLRLHDFECECGCVKEELLEGDPRTASVHCKCGGVMKFLPFGGKAHTFKPFMHPHLDHTPVEIRSWSQYKEELRKRDLANPLAT